jgi:Zn-dependent peptidase ImmA (M78 family)/DNA-binding XRE family transcriptional regulator
MTQDMLAAQAKLDQSYIALIEKGERTPSEEALKAIAAALELPVSYFFQPIRMSIVGDSIRFRASAGVGKKITATLSSETEHYLEILAVLLQRVNPVSVKFKPRNESPKTAAHRLRATLGIDQAKPLPHLVRNFEKLGGIVIALSRYRKFDAFADWVGPEREWPVVAMASGVDPARLRMTIAHEIGHLVLHKGCPIDPLAEHEAFEFGAELLMPEIIVKRVFSSGKPSLDELHELRARWGISEDAVVYSANRIGLMSERQYRDYNVKLRVERRRPESEQGEQPRALRKMAEVAFGIPLPYDKMAEVFHIGSRELEEFFERYAPEKSGSMLQTRQTNVVPMRSQVN